VQPDNTGAIYDPANSPQQYYAKVIPAPTAPENLTPLSYGSNSGGSGPIQDSRLDLAGTSMRQYQGYVRSVAWPNQTGGGVQTWYIPILTVDQTTPISQLRPRNATRFACKPWVAKSANAGQMTFEEAMTAPLFVRGCSQFTVEFAGDYLTQNDIISPSGAVSTVPTAIPGLGRATDLGVATAAKSDGVLDFDVVLTDQGGGPKVPIKKIRWYGMTRSLTGVADDPAPKARWLPNPDLVHPVNWHLRTVSTTPPFTSLPFEKLGTNAFPQNRPPCVDAYTCVWSPYELGKLNGTTGSSSNPPTPNDATYGQSYPNGFMPWMVRITMRVDDPNGRLAEGQTVEWVFNMPHVK
jgi:hypothetical protein